MSKVVDNRVVEMAFDNSNFESNVKNSMSTIESLKQSLNFNDAAKSFGQINTAAKNVNLNGIAAGVESLQQRFSTFGIVGMRTIENLTDSATRLGSKLTSWLTSGVIQGGITRAMNLENAHFQLQGLLQDETKVAAVMKNVNDAVDGTAYSLDSAAKVASQLAASGYEAGDQMYTSLRAVAGVAAMTNSEYSDIGEIFTTVAGQGRLMSYQLQQLSFRGMNAAATLGKYLGKTEAEVREMVTKGEIDFETFAAAMDDAFGEHAKNANKTFTGAMSNIKAALARIGAEFVSPLIEQEGPLVNLFNTIRQRINDVKANIGPLAELFTGSVIKMANAANELLSNFDPTNNVQTLYNFAVSLKNVFSGLLSVLKPIGKAFLDIFPTDVMSNSLLNFSEKLKEITSHLKLSDENAERLRATFRGLFSIASGVVDVISSVVSAIFSLFSGKIDFAGIILSATSALENAGTVFKDFISNVLDKISSTGPSLTKIMDTISRAFSNATEAMSNFLNGNGVIEGSVLVLLVYWLRKALITIKNFISDLKCAGGLDTVRSMLAQITDTLYQMENQVRYDAILKIAIALAVLAGSLLLLSTINVDDLTKGLAAIGALLLMLTSAFNTIIPELKSFSSVKSAFADLIGNIQTIALIHELTYSLIKLAAAVFILSVAVKMLSGIDFDSLLNGLLGVGVLLTELAVFVKAMDDTKLENSVFGIIALATGLLILSYAVKNLASLDVTSLMMGLLAIKMLLVMLEDLPGLHMETAASLLVIGAALNVFAMAVGKFGNMDLPALAKGLIAIAAALKIVSKGTKVMPDDMLVSAAALLVLGVALNTFATAISKFGSMDLGSLAKGLAAFAASLFIVSEVIWYMPDDMIKTAAALLVLGIALNTFVPAIKAIGSLSIGTIARALITLAASFAIIAVVGEALGPIIPEILALSGALALIGVAVLAMGAGLTMAGAGLTALSAGLVAFAGAVVANAGAIVSGLTIIVTGFIDLIPTIAKHLAEGIVTIIKTLADSASQIASAIFKMVSEVLSSLATYAPQIVGSLVDFVVGILNSLTDHMPEFIMAITNFVASLFQAFVDVFKSIDTGSMLQATAALAIVTGMIYALSGITALIPGAMAGVLGLGVIIAELSVVLAVIGGLAQIPGLQWLVEEGGNFLQKIGTAIGQFVGGLAGGIALGFTSSMPTVATNLSEFMKNLEPFISGAKNIDSSIFENMVTLSAAIVAITGASIVNALTSPIFGGNTLAKFAAQLVPFGEAMAEYSRAIKGINAQSITESATAAKALSELANNLPNSGGLVSLFTGDSKLSTFGTELISFGDSMKSYSKAIRGIDPEAITASAAAAKSLAELANNLPDSGGIVSWFTGGNDISSFGEMLPEFGENMKAYATSISGINAEAITASAAAAKSLAELANNLPNSGGIVSWFTGENSLSSFGSQLATFGNAMKLYAKSISGINPDAITSSATAAKSLAELADNLPNSGGLVSIFTGENSLSTFGPQLVTFGASMKSYAKSISGINADAVTASATAAKSLAELANNVPKTGGLTSFFAGEANLSAFGSKLVSFGEAMKSYAKSITGIDSNAVTASATAAKSLAELASNLPKNGGLASFFTGESDFSAFSKQLPEFGEAMKSYARSITGIDSEAVSSSATAAKALAELASNLPKDNSGTLDAWLNGKNVNLKTFGSSLGDFGKAVKEYAKAVAGIDSESVSSSADAVKGLADVLTNLSKIDGDASDKLTMFNSFGDALPKFGENIKKLAGAFKGVDTATISDFAQITESLESMITSITSCIDTLTEDGASEKFGNFTDASIYTKAIETLKDIRKSLIEFASFTSSMDVSAIESNAESIETVISSVNTIIDILTEDGAADKFSGFTDANKYTKAIDALKDIRTSLLQFADFNGISVDSSTLESNGKSIESIITSINMIIDTLTEDGAADKFSSFTDASKYTKAIDTLKDIRDSLVEFADFSGMSVDSATIGSNGKTISDIITNVNTIIDTLTEDGAADKFSSFTDASKYTKAIDTLKSVRDSLLDFATFGNESGSVDSGTLSSNVTTLQSIITDINTVITTLTDNAASFESFASSDDKTYTDAITKLQGIRDALIAFATFNNGDGAVDVGTLSSNVTSLQSIITSISTVITTLTDNADSFSNFSSNETNYTGAIDKLKSIRDALVDFATLSSGDGAVDAGTLSSNVTNLQAIINGISSIITMLTNSAETFGSFASSETNYTGAITKLQSIRDALVAFATFSGGDGAVDAGTMSSNTSSLKTVINDINSIITLLNNSAGTFGNFASSETNYTGAIEKLKTLGSAMKELVGSVGDINGESFSGFKTAAQNIISVINSTAGLDTSGVSGFVDAVAKLGETNVDAFVAAFEGAKDKISSIGTDIMSGLIDSFNAKTGDAKAAITNIVDAMVSAVSNSSDSFGTAAGEAMTKFVKGISDKTNDAKTAMTAAVSQVAEAAKSGYSNMSSAGNYLGDGLVAGINAKKTAAYNAGFALGQAAVRGEKDGQASNSPSKLTMKAGKWFGEGLVIGINKMGTQVYSAGHELGDTAVRSMSASIAKVSSVLDGNLDSQPTIRPVVDMSDVESSVSTINGLFSDDFALGAKMNLNAIGTSMSRRNQNGVNDDVVSAIDKLRKDVGNLENRTYSVGDITYSSGSEVSNAIETLVRAVRVEGRV